MQTNSGLELLPTNNTLIVMPFKGTDGPRTPEEIPSEYATSTAGIMEYVQPKVNVSIDTGNPDSPEAKDSITFTGGVEAFQPASIKKNSAWLRRLEDEYKASEAIVDRIDKSAQFRKALDNPESREAILASLRAILLELEGSIPSDEE
jgi:hypothetical protein